MIAKLAIYQDIKVVQYKRVYINHLEKKEIRRRKTNKFNNKILVNVQYFDYININTIIIQLIN